MTPERWFAHDLRVLGLYLSAMACGRRQTGRRRCSCCSTPAERRPTSGCRHRRGARRTTCCSTPAPSDRSPGPSWEHGATGPAGAHSVQVLARPLRHARRTGDQRSSSAGRTVRPLAALTGSPGSARSRVTASATSRRARPGSATRPVVRDHPHGVAERAGRSSVTVADVAVPAALVGLVVAHRHRIDGPASWSSRRPGRARPGRRRRPGRARRGRRTPARSRVLADLRGVGDARGLDVVDPDRRPGGADPRLPGRELAGAGVAAVEGRAPTGAPARRGRHVVADHPGRQHLRAERLQGVADHLDPAGRQAVGVAVVEPRRDRASRAGRRARRPRGRRGGPGRSTPSAVGIAQPLWPSYHLVPPAVEDRQVEAAVQRRLHARTCRTPPAGAAGCSARRRSPGRASGPSRCRSRAGRRSGARTLGVVGEPHQLLDQLLAAVVGRVRLAGDDDLDRPLRVAAAARSAAPGRAASASAACTTARGGRSRWSARPGRGRCRPSRARPRWRRAAPRTCRTRRRTSATSWARSRPRTAQMSASGTRVTSSQDAESVGLATISGPASPKHLAAPPRSGRARRW